MRRPLALALVLLSLAACSSGKSAARTSASPSPSEAEPTATTPRPDFDDPDGLAFAANGDLWVSNYESSTIARYPAAALRTSGTPHADLVIKDREIDGPNDVLFDRDGWLWSPMYGRSSIVGFKPGARKPTVVIEPADGTLLQPASVAFDKAGNLWVTSASSTYVLRYPRARLHTATPRPDLSLRVQDEACQGITFDGNGWLWRACGRSNLLYGYAPAAYARPGALRATRIVQVPQCRPTLARTGPDGRVWIACYDLHSVAGFVMPYKKGSPILEPRGAILTGVHGITFAADGALWLGTNLNTILRLPKDRIRTGAPDPDLVFRSA